jgi:hypothetical protein
MCASSEEVAGHAGSLLYSVFVDDGVNVFDEKEHGDFSWMKTRGILDEIHSTFKSCSFDKVKRLIGLSMINIDRGCSCLENTTEIISWLVENTSFITEQNDRTNPLIVFRRVVYRFICFVSVI